MFKKATKNASKLRLAIYGTSGSGKTYTSLAIASGFSENSIAVIDTEYGSASKYADIFNFDVCNLVKTDILDYINAIEAAKDYEVLIIDSLSHAWQYLLDFTTKLAATKYKGNSFSAWSDATPLQKKLVSTILKSPNHIIATIRAKTEWLIVDNDGKKSIQKAGLGPEQGKGIEYEFDMLASINDSHILRVEKDRTGLFQDKLIEKPGKQLGQELKKWLNTAPEENFELPTEIVQGKNPQNTNNISNAEEIKTEKSSENSELVFQSIYNAITENAFEFKEFVEVLNNSPLLDAGQKTRLHKHFKEVKNAKNK